MPSSASSTTASGSLISFFICPPLGGRRSLAAGPYRAPRGAVNQAAGVVRSSTGSTTSGIEGSKRRRRGAGDLPPRARGSAAWMISTSWAGLRGRLRRAALALPERAHLVHHLAPVGGVARPDRRAEADLDLVAAGEQPAGLALGPVLARRHRVVGAVDVDRDDVDVVLGGDHGRARADLADAAVARARALGEHQQVPALLDQLVDVVGGAVAEPAAGAAERDGVEQQRDAVGLPAALVEVVGRRGHRGRVRQWCGDGAQDRRGVEVARVVGDEDDRRASARRRRCRARRVRLRT